MARTGGPSVSNISSGIHDVFSMNPATEILDRASGYYTGISCEYPATYTFIPQHRVCSRSCW